MWNEHGSAAWICGRLIRRCLHVDMYKCDLTCNMGGGRDHLTSSIITGAELGIVCVISAFCVAGVPQDQEITRKIPSSTGALSHHACLPHLHAHFIAYIKCKIRNEHGNVQHQSGLPGGITYRYSGHISIHVKEHPSLASYTRACKIHRIGGFSNGRLTDWLTVSSLTPFPPPG